MLLRGAVTALFFSPVLLFGQLSNNLVTVTASQTAGAPADQAVFTLSVQAPIDKSLDTVAGALAGVGITAANLVSFSAPTTSVVAGPGQDGAAMIWNFQLTVSLSKIKDTIAALSGFQQTLLQNQSGLSLSFTLSGTQVSAPADCNAADLIPAARAQAQAIAAAAGLKAGALLAMTTASGSPACSLTATFALGVLFGLNDQHTITITASRSTSLQPDQALISLTVTSRLTYTQDAIAAALTQAGISGATFTGVNSTPVGVTTNGVAAAAAQSVLQWSYTLGVPIAQAGSTVALLLAANQNFAKTDASLSLTFFVEGLQVSPALQASQSCDESGLVNDANATAQKLATAAGVSVGPILSLGSPGTSGPPTALFVRDPFFNVGGALSSFLLGTPANNCSLTVQYQMLS